MDDRSPPMPGTRSTLARTARTNNTSAKINPAHTAMRRVRNTRRISSPRNRCNFNHSQQRHRSSRTAPRKREHKGTLLQTSLLHCIPSTVGPRNTRGVTRARHGSRGSRKNHAKKNTYSHAPTMAPTIGATTGIHASPQREVPLFGIGRIACSRRGIRSRAGFRPGPVGPPIEVTKPHTMKPTTIDAPPNPSNPTAASGSTAHRTPAPACQTSR